MKMHPKFSARINKDRLTTLSLRIEGYVANIIEIHQWFSQKIIHTGSLNFIP